jgi:LPS-assembly lipoprotein
MQNRRRLLGLLGMSVAGSVLSGCGFHLRGSGAVTGFPFQRIYVNEPPSTQLGADLRRQLSPYDSLTVVETPQEAQVVLGILSNLRDKRILTRNSQGRIREYTLTYTLNYRITDGNGKVLLPPSQAYATREMSYNENAALGKETEESLLYRDMQVDVIQQVLRRLALLPVGVQG